MPIAAAQERTLLSTESAMTRRLGAALAAVATAGDIVCLFGDLGAGKSELARGFGAGLGVIGPMASPSFVLMLEHEGRLPLFHVDLYRLEGAADAIAGGLFDERQRDGVTLIEWADRMGSELPADRLEIAIEGSGDEPRTIRLRATSPRYRRFLEAAA